MNIIDKYYPEDRDVPEKSESIKSRQGLFAHSVCANFGLNVHSVCANFDLNTHNMCKFWLICTLHIVCVNFGLILHSSGFFYYLVKTTYLKEESKSRLNIMLEIG